MASNTFVIYGSNFYCGSEPHFYGTFQSLVEAKKECAYWLEDRHAVYLWVHEALLTEGKLFKDIASRMEYIKGQNNWEVNCLDVNVYDDGIYVESICVNEYGRRYGNNDGQFIPKKELSNYTVRKLYML